MNMSSKFLQELLLQELLSKRTQYITQLAELLFAEKFCNVFRDFCPIAKYHVEL